MTLMLIALLLAFILGGLLSVVVHLHYKEKIRVMKEDWLAALRIECEECYQKGYVHGISDEKVVRSLSANLESVTELIPVIK